MASPSSSSRPNSRTASNPAALSQEWLRSGSGVARPKCAAAKPGARRASPRTGHKAQNGSLDRLCNICVRWLTRRDRCVALSAETLDTAR
eukprot:scaffold76882_cov71-Phaeocystis_antarctica.AAC.2